MSTQQEYIDKMKAKLDQLGAKVEEYEAKADEAKADAKISYQKQVNELRAERKEAEEWLDKMVDASGDAWESLQDGFEEAYEKMKRVFS